MTFDVAAESYDRYMGRYSGQLAGAFADVVCAGSGGSALDVGSGPGALTAELVRRLGADAVAAVDPSEPFVEAARQRLPGVDIRLASAESLPFDDDTFDIAAAQLVVHFMSDPRAGIAEMARVTRAGGVVAANVWDHGGGTGPLSPLWTAAKSIDPDAPDESGLMGSREGQLAELFATSGLDDVDEFPLRVDVGWAGFDEWWAPLLLGVGPGGAYVATLADNEREALRQRCLELLGSGSFVITATAWTAVGTTR